MSQKFYTLAGYLACPEGHYNALLFDGGKYEPESHDWQDHPEGGWCSRPGFPRARILPVPGHALPDSVLALSGEGPAPVPDGKTWFGNAEGPHMSQTRRDNAIIPLLLEMRRVAPGIANVRVFYDRYKDFDHLAFDLDGSHYDIYHYKVFCLIKDGWTGFMSTRNFGYRHWDLVDVFAFGRHRDWKVPHPDDLVIGIPDSWRK